jgi:taurine dioxygenase
MRTDARCTGVTEIAEMEIRKLADPLLAEVAGLDITAPNDGGTWKSVYRAFLDHGVLAFRDQLLTPAQVVEFAGRFGRLEPHITKKYWHPEFNELIVMTNLNAEGEIDPLDSKRGIHWHTDMCYREVPARATMLHTLEVPDTGGDTLFANMYLALETMPAGLRKQIDGRHATFRYGGRRADGQSRLEKDDQDAALIAHPIVRPHTDTGRCSVFVNPAHTVGIVGLPDGEAFPLLEEVYAWCKRPEFQARYEWRMGDTIIWDNRCCWHRATGENPLRQPRRFLRATVADD